MRRCFAAERPSSFLSRALDVALAMLLALPLLCSTAQAQELTRNPAVETRGPATAPSPTQGGVNEAAAGVRGASPAVVETAPPATALKAPLPPDPFTAQRPVVFGSQIFTGRFGAVPFAGFNPNYQIAVGDRINVRMWGAFNFDAVQPVDAQGNIFIPNVGPVRVQGVRNAELNEQVEAQVKRVFRANVGIYATLGAAQPVKVYVTGFVRAPGLYGGLSSDSILYYLDQAGGIDPDRGSYLEVDVLRAGQVRAKFNLYRFLLDGQIDHVQLQDGDTIVAYPRKATVQVSGEVLNPYVFEFPQGRMTAADVLAMARPRPSATHLSIVRKVGTVRRSEYYPLAQAMQVNIEDGDEVTVTSDKYPGTILVRIEGAHLGERTLVLPYGARLKDALDRLKAPPQANVAAVQLYRKSVAARQKEMLENSLRGLETYALTARSATSEEAELRTREAEMILKFIERARNVQPRGQVVLANKSEAADTLLEDGDLIRVPERSNTVLVTGEVIFPSALVYEPGTSIDQYVEQAGGYNQGADEARVVVLRQDGSVATSQGDADLQPGDEIMVLPKIETKNIEITRGITQILYQIAVSAKVLLGL
nr:polysaccharide biosynthesis/export family protein [uncultured Caldimonas sp.]